MLIDAFSSWCPAEPRHEKLRAIAAIKYRIHFLLTKKLIKVVIVIILS
jgi:hypothetical protein